MLSSYNIGVYNADTLSEYVIKIIHPTFLSYADGKPFLWIIWEKWLSIMGYKYSSNK